MKTPFSRNHDTPDQLIGADVESGTNYDQLFSLYYALAHAQELLMGMNSVESNDYEYFPSYEQRKELYYIGRELTEYTREMGVGTICFIDRSARPAYIAFTEYWNASYPNERKPSMRFINPKGCITQEDVSNGYVDPTYIFNSDRLKMGVPEAESAIRSQAEVVQEMRAGIENAGHEDEPILLFDACIHTGQTLAPVYDRLCEAGIKPENILVATVSVADLQSPVVPVHMAIMADRPVGVCYPFGHDAMVQKTYGSVVSEQNADPYDQQESRLIRDEIKRAVREQIAEREQ